MRQRLAHLPAEVLVRTTHLRWKLAEWAERNGWIPTSDCTASHSLLLQNGRWWQHDPSNPSTSFYFSASEGQALFNSLVRSHGTEALLSSYAIESGWLLNTWSGLITLSNNRQAAREVSCGCGDRLAVGPRIRGIRESFIALQRNQTNYAHFLVEVAPSLIAFERVIQNAPNLTIGAGFGREILRRAGFKLKINCAAPPSLLRVSHVEVMRMLPSGYIQPNLLRELVNRVNDSVRPEQNGSEVVFLIRSPRDNRQLQNWREAANSISEIYPDLDIVIPGDISFAEQVRRLSRARIVVAAQGAHAINLLWATRLEHYLEITANGDRYVAAVAEALGVHVHFCYGKPLASAGEALPYSQLQFADFSIDTDVLAAAVRSL